MRKKPAPASTPEPPAASDARGSTQPRVLLVSTMPWMFPARLAASFHALGLRVDAVCHAGHPMRYLKHPIGLHRLGWLGEATSIQRAIEASSPDAIVPCDDPAVRALHSLHQDSRLRHLSGVIEKSLGDPAGFFVAERRSALVQLARSMGLLVPRSEIITEPSALAATAARVGYPCVLKRDLTWSGYGTEVVGSEVTLEKAWSRAVGYTAGLRAGRAALRDRRPRTLVDWLTRGSVEAQEFVPGVPANRAVLCRDGKVVAGLSVEALHTAYPGGPASIVRVIDNAEMAHTVDALVGKLGLSGFCGFDFLLSRSGRAFLLELNPRATPVAHLPVADGTHLPSAFYRQVAGAAPLSGAVPIQSELIALFPTEWKRDRNSPFLKTAHHDLPSDEPGLVRAGLKGFAEVPNASRLSAILSKFRSGRALPRKAS
jgi:hypothetical protein